MTEETTKAPISLEDLRPGTAVSGTVASMEMYGAMVDIGLEQNALLHLSQMGNDQWQAGQDVQLYVLKVDKEGRVALTTDRPPTLTWNEVRENRTYQGTVTRLEKFGAFVDIGAERPGMVHVSEMAEGFVQSPEDVVKVGDEVEVRVLKVNRKRRQIDLTMKEAIEDIQDVMADEDDEELPTAMAEAFRRAMGQDDDDEMDMPAPPPPPRNSGKGGRKRGQRRNQHEDIYSRTLRGN